MKQGTERQRVWHPQSKSYALVWDVGRGVFYCWEAVVRKGRSSYGLSCSSYQPYNKRLELRVAYEPVYTSWKSALVMFIGNRSVKSNTLVDFKKFQGNGFKGCEKQWFEDISVSFGKRLALLCYFPYV